MRVFQNVTWKGPARAGVILLTLLLVVVMSTSVLLAAGPDRPAGPPDMVEVLVGFHGRPDRGVAQSFGGEVTRGFRHLDVLTVRISERALPALEGHPQVRYVEPNGEVWADQTVPWGIDRVFGEETFSFPTWGMSRGSGVGVAVLDTGIDRTHGDLSENVAGGTNTIDHTHWYDDGNGHGTHVAGTIAAVDNAIGVVGVAPSVSLYGVKVLSDSGGGTWESVAAGIDWVIDNKAAISVINMSLGGSAHSQTLQDACDLAFSEGILLISSAGNNGLVNGRGDNVGYPARYSSVIAVAASDSSNRRARFSSTGPAVELIAPGVSVLSTVPGDGYASYSGTSMAAPHVAGAAALVFGADTSLGNGDVRMILAQTAQDLGLEANHQGHGLVRADRAVRAVDAGQPDPPEPQQYTLTISTEGQGSTTPAAGTHVYDEGAVVPLSAEAAQGWTFDRWEIGEATVDSAQTTVTMTGDVTAVAVFVESETPPQPPDDPGPIVVEVSTDRPSYPWNSWVQITSRVTDETGVPVYGAAVTLTVRDPDGNPVGSSSGTTAADGTYGYRYRVPNRSATGEYTVQAQAVSGASTDEKSIAFLVTGR